MKGIIVVHGTSQDITSTNEVTTQIAKAARSAGYFVVDIGGPGSTERSIKRCLKWNPLLEEATSLHEIEFPLDYAWNVVSGTATGSGIDDIIKDIQDAVELMLKQGVTSIDLVGFSRGAVALALALERVQKETKVEIRLPIPLGVCLLDPVPGPYFVPKRVEIPPFVDRLMLLTSKHEGRPGFTHLDISVSSKVKFTGDLLMGVHGDIGGSTQSDMTLLVRDQVAKFVGLPALQLSMEERLLRTLKIIADPSKYVNPGIPQWLSRRAIGWSGHEHHQDVLELPSASSAEELWKLPLPPLVQPKVGKLSPRPVKLVIPSRPIRDKERRIVFPPSRVDGKGSALTRKVQYGLSWLLKKFKK